MLDSSESSTIPDFEFSLTLDHTHITHTNTRIFRRQSVPEVQKARPSMRGGGGHVRAPFTVVHSSARSQTCAGADGDVSTVKDVLLEP